MHWHCQIALAGQPTTHQTLEATMRSVKYVPFKGRLVVLGFGSIGKAALPLILRHIEMSAGRVKIISRSADKSGIAQELGVEFVVQALNEENFEAVLDVHLSE